MDSLKQFTQFRGLLLVNFYFIDIIRFVLPLAFQCHILNSYTAKTRKVTVKIVRAVENNEEMLCCVRVQGWGGGGGLATRGLSAENETSQVSGKFKLNNEDFFNLE